MNSTCKLNGQDILSLSLRYLKPPPTPTPMTPRHFRLFLTIIIVLALVVTALYTRYTYMGPYSRYDFWYDEYQTMIKGGNWAPEKLVEKET